ncbi:MAG: ligase-associated DNA damage response endonuclease PdeM [Planctomycetota bacterium]
MRVNWSGESWRLLSERALLRERDRTLLVADLHLGKSAVFRAQGLPMPDGPSRETLDRLTHVLRRSEARRLFVLGDLFHARASRTPELGAQLAAWRERHAEMELLLVRGNHDRHAGDPDDSLRFTCVSEPWTAEGVMLRHTPASSDAPSIAGHLHPCFKLRDRAHGNVRAPCFVLDERQLLLPAFGAFTGHAEVSRAPGRRLFVVGPDAVIEV